VSSLITADTCGCDIYPTVLTTILAGKQMLSRTLKMSGLLYADAALLGEQLWRVLPHGEAAVTALAVLTVKSSSTIFGYSTHGRSASS